MLPEQGCQPGASSLWWRRTGQERAAWASLAKSVTRQLIAPRDLRASLVSWINFVFLPEAVNRWVASGMLS